MRYTGAKCRLCRREGAKLFLKGDRCFTAKCPIERKGANPPGVHSRKYTRKLSDYGFQLREKQKAKRLYGVTEKQLKNYYQKAAKERASTGEVLIRQLEMRLDNVVFRSGLAPSRSVARQLVNHGHILVNGKKIDIVSLQVKPGDTLNIDAKGMEIETVKKLLSGKPMSAPWICRKAAVAKIERVPQREEMEPIINERLIVEFYSR